MTALAEKRQVYLVRCPQPDFRPSPQAGVGPEGCQGRGAGESSARGRRQQDRRHQGRSQEVSERPFLSCFVCLGWLVAWSAYAYGFFHR